jgi:hypothetical protein
VTLLQSQARADDLFVRRYWRFGVAIASALVFGRLIPGTLGVIIGVPTALTAILLVERRLHRQRR